MADDGIHTDSEAEAGFPGFADLAPVTPPAPAAQYRVLARKYRPAHFGDLIGQEPMVRTLTNAFAAGRIPQAWMLTGVRGVGKTTTARILARGLNFERMDGTGGPTTELKELGRHCQAIIDGRHIDVMEIDAASNNGVDNIRALNDAVRYAPANARYKVYIIDEVHMMSGPAFNAFLKTLEEPPPHAKFIFATTEIRKVPVTILSRCQRFDLRRVDASLLLNHLTHICAAESVAADADALSAIVRAAEGSVRDSLSLLDQAIAHSGSATGGRIVAEDVRAMLGLADRARVVDLFEQVMRGDLAAALGEFQAQYDVGADPIAVLAELAEFTHLVTRLKVIPDAVRDPALSEVEKTRGLAFAQALSLRVLTRAWQLLTKGLVEIRDAGRPISAAQMLLVRLVHAADLPTPDDALRALRDAPPGGGGSLPHGGSGGGSSGGGSSARMTAGGAGLASRPVLASTNAMPQALTEQPAMVASAPTLQPVIQLHHFADLVALAGNKRDLQIKAALERDVRLVAFEDGRISFAMAATAQRSLPSDLKGKLRAWTGRDWDVKATEQDGQATLREQAEGLKQKRESDALSHPLVQAVLGKFPGARIVDVRGRGEQNIIAAASPGASADGMPDSDDGLAEWGEDPYIIDDM